MYLVCAPTHDLQPEIPQVVFAEFLGDHSASGILVTGPATVRSTQQVLALAVGLSNNAIGDPHPVDPPNESPPFAEHLDLGCGEVDPQAVQRNERERLEPRLTARIDQS